MAIPLRALPLGALVDAERGIAYGIVQPGQHIASGVPIVRVTDVRDGRVNNRDPLRVSPDVAAKHRRTTLQGGELLLTLVGTVGETAVAPSELTGWNTARAVAVIPVRPDPGARWVEYALRTDIARGYIDKCLNTTVQATLNLRDLTTLPVPMPDRATRDAILSILSAFDDKIELNRRMSETLEGMARALFRSWLVDFDPVRVKAEGRKPSGIDERAARLFPCELEDSELGKIPKGWSVASLGDIAAFKNGLALQRFRPTGDEARLPVVKIAQLRTGEPDIREWARADIDPGCVLEDGDVVFSWSGSLTVVVWCGGRAALNQHLFRVTSEKYPKWFYLEWLHVHLPELQRIAEDKATTMGHIKRHHLSAARCVVPPMALLEQLSARFESLLAERMLLDLQSGSLRRTRDMLLAPLLSGEVDVPAMLLRAERAHDSGR